MAGEKVVWGIDVGQCALKALKLQLVDGEVEAVAFDIVEHAKPLNPNERGGEGLTELLTRAVETLMGRHDMVGDSVVVGVPGYQSFTRFTKLPPVEKKRLGDIVRFEADQQIPYDIDQVIWDYQIFSEEDSPDVEVGIFCMRTEQLNRYLTPFTDAGLQPVIVQPAPLALFNFIEHDAARPGKATVLLDIGAESTDLIIADRGGVWTRAVPIGGNNFTERLVEAFRLEFPKAEGLKRQAATSKYARQIFQAMRPVYQDLVAEIQRSVGRYTQTHRDAKLDKVVGMGNGFRLPGLQKFLQQNLGMRVERLSAFNVLTPGESLNAPTLNENVLSLGVAYGLAVQGLGRARIESNLLPPQIAKRAIWRRKRPFFAATAACMVLAACSLWARYFLDTSALANNGGGEPVIVPSFKQKALPNAIRNLNDGLAPRKYTAQVLGITNSLTSEYDKLSRAVEEGTEDAKNIVALLTDQALWPRIVDLIHRALPVTDESLVKAGTLGEYLAVVKKLPRKDRRQIFIDSFSTVYVPNVAEVIGPTEAEEEAQTGSTGRGWSRKSRSSSGGRSSGRRSTKSSKSGALVSRTDGRGFIVRIKGWTPYQHSDIIDNFREELETLGSPRDPKKAEELGFYILMPQNNPVPRARNPQRVIAGKPEPTEAADEKSKKDDPDRDPVTGEWWFKDWEFQLTFGVVLGPSPTASAEAKDTKTSGRWSSKTKR